MRGTLPGSFPQIPAVNPVNIDFPVSSAVERNSRSALLPLTAVHNSVGDRISRGGPTEDLWRLDAEFTLNVGGASGRGSGL